MSAGYVSEGAHHHRHCKSAGQGDREQAYACLAIGAKVLVGTDASRTGKNQRECADEFNKELLAQAVHGCSTIVAK
jgi:hypothetical protein